MIVGRFFGWLLLFGAGVVLVRDALIWLDLRIVAPLSLQGLWSDLNADGLRATREAIMGLAPWIWSVGIAPVLSLWALPVFAVLGLVLLWVCRRPHHRRYR